MHLSVSGNLTIIGSDNGLSPSRHQAIIWTNAGILLIVPFGTNFSEISVEILTISFRKICLKVSSPKWRPFCLSLNVLKHQSLLGISQCWVTLICWWCPWLPTPQLPVHQWSLLSLVRFRAITLISADFGFNSILGIKIWNDRQVFSIRKMQLKCHAMGGPVYLGLSRFSSMWSHVWRDEVE